MQMEDTRQSKAGRMIGYEYIQLRPAIPIQLVNKHKIPQYTKVSQHKQQNYDAWYIGNPVIPVLIHDFTIIGDVQDNPN